MATMATTPETLYSVETEDSVETASSSYPTGPFSPTEREAIYEDFQPLVKRLMRQYGDTPEMREDLKGEIYYRFCALLEEFDPSRGIHLYAYLVRKLTTSTYSYARSRWRQRDKKRKYEVSWEEESENGLQVSDEWEEPLEKKIREEEQARLLEMLRGGIHRLTERQRNVVIWRYYDALSFDEIALRLEVKPATVRSLLRHALNNLRNQMAGQLNQD